MENNLIIIFLGKRASRMFRPAEKAPLELTARHCTGLESMATAHLIIKATQVV